MRKEEIEEVVRIAAAEVLVRREEIIKDEYDARYQDVKLLMKNYRRLKTYYAKVSPETLEVDAIFSMRRKTGRTVLRHPQRKQRYHVQGGPDPGRGPEVGCAVYAVHRR